MTDQEWTENRLGGLIRQAAQGPEWEAVKTSGEAWPDFLARKLYAFSGEALNAFAESTLIPGVREVNDELRNSLGKVIGIHYEANKPVKMVLDPMVES